MNISISLSCSKNPNARGIADICRLLDRCSRIGVSCWMKIVEPFHAGDVFSPLFVICKRRTWEERSTYTYLSRSGCTICAHMVEGQVVDQQGHNIERTLEIKCTNPQCIAVSER